MKKLALIGFLVIGAIFALLEWPSSDRQASRGGRDPESAGTSFAPEPALPESGEASRQPAHLREVRPNAILGDALEEPATEPDSEPRVSEFEEELRVLQLNFDSRQQEILAQLEVLGSYEVLEHNSIGQKISVRPTQGMIQVFTSAWLGERQELRQFDIRKDEYPDLYLMQEHIHDIEGKTKDP